jgi:hypothetical protein
VDHHHGTIPEGGRPLGSGLPTVMTPTCILRVFSDYAERTENMQRKILLSTMLDDVKGTVFRENLMGEHTVNWPIMNKLKILFYFIQLNICFCCTLNSEKA